MTHVSQQKPSQTSSLNTWLNYLGDLHVSAIDLGLSRVLPVAQALDITKPNATVFTVAGTNGKGSTTATISAITTQAGYNTALYQSPHVISFNERIQINNQPVSDQTLINAFVTVDAVRIKLGQSLSFFEATTLAAMLIFKEAHCDVWVLEIGLGGRLDVVNIIEPSVTVITNIGIDHVDWLGDDREQIGYEKAGILRHNTPCVLSSNDMPASVWKTIQKHNCPNYVYSADYSYTTNNLENDAVQTWLYSNKALTMTLPMPTLALENVAAAITAVLASKLSISQADISLALSQLNLLGRFHHQVVKLPKKSVHTITDAVHNPDGVKFLLKQLLPLWQQHKQQYASAQLHIVFSMLTDKDIEAVLKTLYIGLDGLVHNDLIWHTAPLSVHRAASLQQLTQAFAAAQISSCTINTYKNIKTATEGAYHSTGDNDKVLICGSFHTIADAFTAPTFDMNINIV